uniref:Uncharacterized protein n=1 Tax=Guillardia theta TaxID=55529 RepID=A0A7S4KMD5_GUITH|mmetsp:Transcript_27063/g.88477  ORF Transcript_27063/g.88477 Transcript_27063/m.88477 type:complete len:553 (+) Transcript_27063:211-1869(+)
MQIGKVEYRISLLTVSGALAWLAYSCTLVSREHHTNLQTFRDIISRGWIPFSTGIDLTDSQWRTWRSQAVYLLPYMILMVHLRRWLCGSGRMHRVSFTALWSIMNVIILHGNGTFYLLAFTIVNYYGAKLLVRTRYMKVFTWIFSFAMLLLSKLWDDMGSLPYLQGLSSTISFLEESLRAIFGPTIFSVINSYSGVYRWNKPFNLLFLRIISYNCDVCDNARNSASVDAKGEQKNRTIEDGFLTYLCFLLYPPLYATGPLIHFEDFSAQLHTQRNSESAAKDRVNASSGWRLMFKCALYFLAMEFMLHFIHLHAISRNLHTIFHLYSKSVLYLPPWEVMAVGFYMLNYTYMKFLIIWRSAMSVAKMDEIETIDNMNRCVCNNYTFVGFWRSWHRSLHMWVLRYMYHPMGGHSRRLLIVWPIFIFIGLWHDLEWTWLAWALFNCAFMTFEISVSKAFKGSSLQRRCEDGLGKWLGLLAIVLNIYLLILSNLAILYGFQGSYDFVRAFLFPPPPGTLMDSLVSNVIGLWWVVSGIILMLYRRQEEKLRGDKKTF